MGLLDGMNWERDRIPLNCKEVVTNAEEKNFHKNRTMFYLDEKSNVIFPEKAYENLSHREWFCKIGINYDITTRGYRLEDSVHLYVGVNFAIPRMSTVDLYYLLSYFMVDKIKLGCEVGKVGEVWKPIFEFNRIRC